jgi:hypothetical protein
MGEVQKPSNSMGNNPLLSGPCQDGFAYHLAYKNNRCQIKIKYTEQEDTEIIMVPCGYITIYCLPTLEHLELSISLDYRKAAEQKY